MNPIYSENPIKFLVTEICKRHFYRTIGGQKIVLQTRFQSLASDLRRNYVRRVKVSPCSRRALAGGRPATLKISRRKERSVQRFLKALTICVNILNSARRKVRSLELFSVLPDTGFVTFTHFPDSVSITTYHLLCRQPPTCRFDQHKLLVTVRHIHPQQTTPLTSPP